VLAVAALMAAEVHMGYPGVRSWLPYVVLLPLAVVALVRLGRWRVEVDDDDGEAVIRVGTRALPVRRAGRTDVVSGPGKQQALGPELDPTAHVLHRPWVAAAVRIEDLDPDDATPYWIVSSRRPQGLVEAIEAHRGR
jgi:hypothetical protein